MDPNRAIQYGQLVQAAYALAAMAPTVPLPAAGSPLNSAYDPFQIGYTIEHVIFGNDLATDITPAPVKTVPYGLILSTASNDVVVAIRGTEGIWEWLHDFAFLQQPCPFLSSGGDTEDGFTDIYTSLAVDKTNNKIIAVLKSWPVAIKSLTITGHSLGAALATLLSLDVAANTPLKSVISYTFASPRVGDNTFVNTYDQVVPFTYRIANRCDIVPKLPLPPLYGHVAEVFELNPIANGKLIVEPTIPCEHSMVTYLYLLSLLPGAISQTLDQGCKPATLLNALPNPGGAGPKAPLQATNLGGSGG